MNQEFHSARQDFEIELAVKALLEQLSLIASGSTQPLSEILEEGPAKILRLCQIRIIQYQVSRRTILPA
ncbi:hypothetical protein A2160_01245 [Candidatus Beckwithbacteria bacterium RBG_13_42_9]|uniref:Uncharacterized protein n=1 Tax=Candidatus Beckwithbacteria bacterium RBG_13_42_9 TaxID=1797457 RepID=A0A1F5E4D3_9BACT|nr:MAG: hypothetical protein A2160_01245 [Candidatus Beckwithbacteria bacterium RBG_13_42_9]